MGDAAAGEAPKASLARELGLLALIATSVCTVIGGGINNLTVQMQKMTPGIADGVPTAFVLGAFPAIATALCYAVLATAMPRAGGSYIYISRAAHPYVGFIASFSEWFGLTAAVGVISYMDVPLLEAGLRYFGQAIGPAAGGGFIAIADLLLIPAVKLLVALGMVWLFWGINVVGLKTYGITVIAMMTLMFLGGLCVMVTGLTSSPQDFAAAWEARHPTHDVAKVVSETQVEGGGLGLLVQATATLFFAYIGFTTISQAGGEARNPRKTLPWAFVISVAFITGYYLLFSYAIYKAAPWQFIYWLTQQAETKDVTAPHIIGVLMPPAMAAFVAFMAGLTLADDIPPILLAVSRLFFSWAQDGIFPRRLADVHQRFRTPHHALTVSATVASVIILICHWDQSFAAGVNVVNVAFISTYLVACVTTLTFPRRNPALYANVKFLRSRGAQVGLSWLGIVTLGAMLIAQLHTHLSAFPENPVDWLKNPAALWVRAGAVGSAMSVSMWRRRKKQGWDLAAMFERLPEEEEEVAGARS